MSTDTGPLSERQTKEPNFYNLRTLPASGKVMPRTNVDTRYYEPIMEDADGEAVYKIGKNYVKLRPEDGPPRCETEREIAEGVYLVHDKRFKSTDIRRVVKRIEGSDMEEVLILAQIEDPNIVKVYDLVVTKEGVPFVIMEYCESDLESWIKQGHKLPDIIAMFNKIAGAVQVVHKRKYVHRDLTIVNILLDKDEDVKISDFGLSKSITSETRGKQMGTPAFATIEQAEGIVDPKTDVYALCSTLFAMLTGNTNPRALQQEIMNLQGGGRLTINPRILPKNKSGEEVQDMIDRISAVLKKGLQQNMDNRYSSVEILKEEVNWALFV